MALLHIRIEDQLKNEVSEILDDVGLDMTTAVRMFFKRVAKDKSIDCLTAKDAVTKYVNFDNNALRYLLLKRLGEQHPEATVAGFWMEDTDPKNGDSHPTFSVPVLLGIYHGETSVTFQDSFQLTYRAIFKNEMDEELHFYNESFSCESYMWYKPDYFDITDKPKYEVVTGESEREKYLDRIKAEEFHRKEFLKTEDCTFDTQLSKNLSLVRGKESFVYPANAKDKSVNASFVQPNVAVVGGAGSGKSRHFLVPNMLKCGCSFVVTDQYGEYYERCKDQLLEEGYDIKVFSITGNPAHKSECYNPFELITSEHELIEFAELITRFFYDTPNKKQLRQNIMAAVLYYVYKTCPQEEQTLRSVYKIIRDLFYSDKKVRAETIRMLNLFITENAGGTPISGLWQQFMSADSTLKEEVFQEYVKYSKSWFEPILDITDNTTIDLSLLGKRKTAIFIIFPGCEMQNMYLCSMLVNQAQLALMALADMDHGGKLEVPVKLFLDQYGILGTKDNFGYNFDALNQRGISVIVVAQNLLQADIQAPNFLSKNFGALVYLGGVEMKTQERIQKLIARSVNCPAGSKKKKADVYCMDNSTAMVFIKDKFNGSITWYEDKKCDPMPLN